MYLFISVYIHSYLFTSIHIDIFSDRMCSWNSTFVIKSDDGKDYLTDEGQNVLNNGNSFDILKLFFMNGYDEIISHDLKPNDIIKAPQWNWYKFYKDCRWDLYRFTMKGDFIKFKQYEKSDEEIVNFEITELSWFKINKTIYFPSQSMKKIAKLSEYWTDEGQSFLMNRRKEYLMVRDNPEFGPNQVKPYKQIPHKWSSSCNEISRLK